MRFKQILSIALLASCGMASVFAQGGSDQAGAEKLFQQAQFAQARQAYESLRRADPKSFHAHLRLGQIALLENRLPEAEKWLKQAIRLKPDDKSAKVSLAEAYYRQDDFSHAAPLFRAVGREVVAKKLESFSKRKPYQVKTKTVEAHVKFLQTDPLPLISARVNRQPVNLLIDTGGAELILSAEFAKAAGVETFGETSGLLASGRTALLHGHVDSLTLGDLEVRDLPAQILDGRAFAAGAPGKKVDGVIGTVFLYHFLSTLDYVNGELILRPKTKQSLRRWQQAEAGQAATSMPFWMAGDHFLLAWGRINDSPPVLWFVDTGLAGGGFVGTPETLKMAGIEVAKPPADSGAVVAGASGFVVKTLALGDAVEHDISGFQGQLGSIGGVRVAGIISHQFFRPYALTLDFQSMRLTLRRTEGRAADQPSSHPPLGRQAARAFRAGARSSRAHRVYPPWEIGLG